VASTSGLEPGSFRDPDSRVLYAEGRVLRILSERGLADWQALAATRFFLEQMGAGRVVETELVDSPDGLPDGLRSEAAALLRHERVPFVSYPYEWPFSMLKDAALLQLELLLAALEEDMVLKDSSPYNVQWRGAEPVFVDVGSFERLREGEPWVGYRQFCMLFLYPLLLQAHKGVDFQPWLRGRIDGIAPGEIRNLMSARDLLRKGVLTHVVLHSRLERRHASRAGEIKRDLRAAGFKRELIRANVRGLEKLVRRLDWRPAGSTWSDYGRCTSYAEDDAERKASFVREALAVRERGLVWDIGCNDGRFARLAAEHARTVVALDADHAVVDGFYRVLRHERPGSILPLVVDAADPSPSLGWRGRERADLLSRGAPELILCLALLHHLAIARSIPIPELVRWLRGHDSEVLVEFVAPEDPMAQRLLAAKRPETHSGYDRESFERALSEAFEVERRETLPSGTRVLYVARPRS
jgi:hypothetical protein